MGIVENTKQYIVKRMTNATNKIGSTVTSLSALSPEQLAAIDEKRTKYLSQKPDMDSEAVKDVITKNLGAVGIEVYQAYVEQLKHIYKPVDAAMENFDAWNRIRYFDITKWVTDAEENALDRLVNVYQVLSQEACNIALIYHRTKEKCAVTLGVVNTDPNQSDPTRALTYYSRLVNALRGNFPGVEIVENRGSKDGFGVGIPQCLNVAAKKRDGGDCAQSVAIVSNLASEKSENFISQSMEKLLDGIVPQRDEEEYTIVLLANPVINQLEKKNRLFEIASALAPYASWQTNYTLTESEALNASASFGINLGMSAGVQSTMATAVGTNHARVDDTLGKGIVHKAKQMVGMYAPIQDTNTTTYTSGYQASANFGVSFSRSSSVTTQIGINEGITQNYSNYGVQHTLDLIDKQIKRLEESAALGMWEFAAYIVSQSPVVANNAAHMYLALTQGEESYMTRAGVNLWDGEEEQEDAAAILQSIQKLQHPVFGLREALEEDWLMYPTLVTPSAVLSGKELARALNFPRRSVSGLPVLESVSFGREVQIYKDEAEESQEEIKTIDIGNIYHMRRSGENVVSLDVDSLCSHVFVTGTTGSGKSNTIYYLLDQLRSQGIHFLVVEPSKGEYKKIFGQTCRVYGTNGSKMELLRMNPFSFPDDIHVLEHIDRLIEIFNACWPMYAAMPAVLKDAVEKSYEKVGWNLRYSKCEPMRFPTFFDLMEILPKVMESSLYSAETKSDYAGALITRVRSLTNGINGQIFCSQRELTGEELFEQNVIVDISRVGSVETKALFMGIIVMKLQEYRMQLDQMNVNLRHITVLEEAHHLLRKTSAQQSQEGANLQGKSVEMLTNAIAEMRTYGEGFVIADQAPELLDEAVIRNTNTKIALRLPDEADRRLVGLSMALKENQIMELSKFPKGVAAVYQNNWVDAVLCKFEKYKKEETYEYSPNNRFHVFEHYFNKIMGIRDDYEITQEDVDQIKEWIYSLRNLENTKNLLFAALNGETLSKREQEIVAYNIFDGKRVGELLKKEENAADGIYKANKKISVNFDLQNDNLIDKIRLLIIQVIEQETKDRIVNQRDCDLSETGRVK